MKKFLILFILCLLAKAAQAIRVDDFLAHDTVFGTTREGPVMASDGKGHFIVSWLDITIFEKRITYLQQFNLDGGRRGPLIQVPPAVEGDDTLNSSGAVPAYLPNGNIALAMTFHKDTSNASGYFMAFDRGYLQILDSLGNPVTPAFVGDTLTLKLPTEPNGPDGLNQFRYYTDIVTDKYGNFTILINSGIGNSGSYKVYFQKFDQSGIAIGPLVHVSEGSAGNLGPKISMNPEGRFVVIWYALHPLGGGDVPYGRIYNPDGTPVGDAFMVSCDDTLTQRCGARPFSCLVGNHPSIAIDSVGNFMAAYGVCNGDPNGHHVYAESSIQTVPQKRPISG